MLIFSVTRSLDYSAHAVPTQALLVARAALGTEQKMETTTMRLGFRRNGEEMETTIMGLKFSV